jgi:hypothetical protein
MQPTAALSTPYSLKIEHEELHGELKQAMTSGGSTGEAAKEVARVLPSHFLKEEEYAMPLLGLLSVLMRQKTAAKEPSNNQPELGLSNIGPPIRDAAISMAERLAADLSNMLEEHEGIIAALDKLKVSAAAENKKEQVHFAEKLALHAKTEEEVLYPAAILIGDYLKENRTVH